MLQEKKSNVKRNRFSHFKAFGLRTMMAIPVPDARDHFYTRLNTDVVF